MPIITTKAEDPSVGISLSLKKSTLDAVRRIAKNNERSLSWIVDHAVQDWIERNKPVPASSNA